MVLTEVLNYFNSYLPSFSRQLEKNLLTCLNEAKGRILDDDNVINTLEILKSEAAEVGRKVDETDQVRFN